MAMRLPILGVCWLVGCAGGLNEDEGGSIGLGDGSTGSSAASTGVDGDSTQATADGTDDTTSPGTTSADDTSTGEADTEGPAACSQPWRVVRSTGTLTDVTLDPTTDTVLAVGALPSGEGWAMALDACDGTVLADTTVVHGPADSTRLDGLVLHDGALFVVGSVELAADPRNGLYARLDPTDLSTLWTTPLYGSTDRDEVLDITVADDGRVWMVGTSHYDTTPTAWGISGNLDGMACGFGWNGLDSGSARAVQAVGGEVVVAVDTSAGALVLLRYDSACTCGCTPTWESAPIVVGDMDTGVGELLVHDGQYYVAGWANDGGTVASLYAQVTWVSSMGTVIEIVTDDPSPEGDGLFAVHADADRLYVGGGTDWTGQDGFVEAHALLRAVSFPLAPGAAPDWEVSPADVDYVQAIGLDEAADGYLYVGGNVDTVGAVVRCDKQGLCG